MQVLLQRTKNIDNLTAHYVFALGVYRGLYIVNWIWRFFREGHVDWHSWVGGTIQTALLADFMYYYYLAWKSNTRLKLPA